MVLFGHLRSVSSIVSPSPEEKAGRLYAWLTMGAGVFGEPFAVPVPCTLFPCILSFALFRLFLRSRWDPTDVTIVSLIPWNYLLQIMSVKTRIHGFHLWIFTCRAFFPPILKSFGFSAPPPLLFSLVLPCQMPVQHQIWDQPALFFPSSYFRLWRDFRGVFHVRVLHCVLTPCEKLFEAFIAGFFFGPWWIEGVSGMRFFYIFGGRLEDSPFLLGSQVYGPFMGCVRGPSVVFGKALFA